MSSLLAMQSLDRVLARKLAIELGEDTQYQVTEPDATDGSPGAVIGSVLTVAYISNLLAALESMPARLGIMRQNEERQRRKWVFTEGRKLWNEIPEWAVVVDRLLEEFGALVPPAAGSRPDAGRAIAYVHDRNDTLQNLPVPCGFYGGAEAEVLAALMTLGLELERRLHDWSRVAAVFHALPNRPLPASASMVVTSPNESDGNGKGNPTGFPALGLR